MRCTSLLSLVLQLVRGRASCRELMTLWTAYLAYRGVKVWGSIVSVPVSAQGRQWWGQLSHTHGLETSSPTHLPLGPAPLCWLVDVQGLLSSVLPPVRDGASSLEHHNQ